MLALRLDAAYCLLVGAGVVCCAGPLAQLLRLPGGVLPAAGAVTTLWGAGVAWMSARMRLRRALRLVLAVNVLASAAVALFSTSAAGLLLALGVLAFALDIAAFAVAQGLALRRLRAAEARG